MFPKPPIHPFRMSGDPVGLRKWCPPHSDHWEAWLLQLGLDCTCCELRMPVLEPAGGLD